METAPAAPPRERSVRLEELAGTRVGVWGHGREGHAAVRAALTAGAAGVHVVDARPVDPAGLPTGVTVSADVADLAGCAFVVRSPGISPYRPEARELAERTCVTTGTGIALAEFARRAVPTLCVTGTKGKSTTSALAAAVLEAAGRPAVHAGNIGTPLLDVLLDGTAEQRTLVVEISSYQAAAVPDFTGLGALTSLAPEHLDWHGDAATYYRDKLRVFSACPPRSVAVAPQARELAGRYLDPAQLVDPAALVPADLAGALAPQHLLGEHNRDNARLALAACALLGVDLAASAEAVLGAVGGFRALPHRLSPVARRGDVTFVDDTLSTTPVSVLAALDALAGRPVTLIAGGQDRGLDYTGLASALAARSDAVALVTVPDTGARLAADVRRTPGGAEVAVTEAASLDDAVAAAIGTTAPGGVVLLSPGAPSYNRFRNYEELAARFTELVLAAGATALPGAAR
ncbi:UDP-N-acetylmuramoyl-L-alanine--D-glutamate ligase [Trujillonella endophytica]|uniref:UDP-N-acetylmuramoyl-L-alanine--L-glutamate ligase n=1 Tax=Trujillonella endophytica TaxID=673521 RepID=A0A1H8RG10_9ACTN|nr:UDP-N-acetylmuramoyl-L-alanine--D-glutamate ligase [Trujillella endophytica]SEO65084.1 UDP-N-acetylmuramoylalanine--D-glutamate ligase [Trujillella endophytica]